MDVITLAPLVVSALVPLFKEIGNKALNKIAEKSGEEVFNHRAAILDRVKNIFAGEEITTLGLLAENPEDLKILGKLEGKLEERLKDNPEIAGDLEDLLAKLNKAVSTQIITERIKDSEISNKLKRSGDGGGDAAIENRDISGSKINSEIDIS